MADDLRCAPCLRREMQAQGADWNRARHIQQVNYADTIWDGTALCDDCLLDRAPDAQ